MNVANALNRLLEGDTRRLFWRVFAVTAVLKLGFAAALPLTGDEAYFVVWGDNPDYGYYDHGPMTGWWISLALLLGRHAFTVRLPAVAVGLLTALVLRRVVRDADPKRADLAATLFLLSPVNLAGFLITTDLPLALFSILAGAAAHHGCRSGRLREFFVAGLFLGLAFLSKYFAVLLGLAFAVALLLGVGDRPRPAALAVLFLGVLPSAAVNIAWNHGHAWTNVMFNLYTRNADAEFSLLKPLELLASVAILLGPALTWMLVRPRLEGRLAPGALRRALEEHRLAIFAVAWFVPHAVFLAVAFVQNVRLHWIMSFHPFLFPVLAVALSSELLRRAIRRMAWFTLPLFALVAIALLLPVELLKKHRRYDSIVLGVHPELVFAALAPHLEGRVLASHSYAKAALLAFHADRNVPVFGGGSWHGRQDDLLTDYRALDGADFVVFTDRPERLRDAHRWFRSARFETFTALEASFTIVLGDGFDYAAYREDVLARIAADYYDLPPWLRRIAAPVFFTERYGLPQPSAE